MAHRARLRLDLHDLASTPETEAAAPAFPLCPLCGRPIPPGARASKHHLVPKLKGGAKGETVLLHQVCHSAIHARFSEAELARRLHDVDSLRQDPALTDFVVWIRTKPDDFHARTASTRGKRRAKRDGDHRHA